MKALLISCLVLVAVASAQAAPDAASRQKDLNTLLTHVDEPLKGDLKAKADGFNPAGDLSQYKDGGAAVSALLKEIKDGRVLAQKSSFSLFNPRQREEALMLFKVFMNCKSWEAAISNAAYFRERMNEGEFVYAVYTAVIHSDLGNGLVLPPLYEVTPHLFTNSEVIQKAYTAQMTQTPGKFHMEFTGSKKNPEQRVAYFGEDIGLNTHHVSWHMDFPFWWDDSFGYTLDRKGELFFWAHHQLTARFDSERLSNNLDLVDELYWDRPIVEGFAPHTTYKYGGEFPSRPDNTRFEDVDGVVRVRDMIIHESRIRDAIAHGYITSADGTKIDIRGDDGIDRLGDIIESSVYSPNARYYGALHNEAHILLGRQGDPHGKFKLPPGVMEHFETATRDPAFFRLHKYMDNLFKEYKDSLPPYSEDDLEFSDITLEEISVDGPLETYFENYEFDLSNAVDSSDNIARVAVSAEVKRLNHKPFNFNFKINNGGAGRDGIIRVFLCPRRDFNGQVLSFEEGRWSCVELDKFWAKLGAGSNTVTRSSTDASTTVPDVPSFKKLIADANAGKASSSDFDRSCGIPNRLLLPKGKSSGMEFALVVAVSNGSGDSAPSSGSHSQCGVRGEKYPDSKPMGFPLDRRIDDARIFRSMPNVDYTIVTVTHQG